MLLTSWPYFHFVGFVVGLIIGLAIDNVVFIVKNIAISLLGYFLWNKLMSFLKR